jgi:hypothetical protein
MNPANGCGLLLFSPLEMKGRGFLKCIDEKIFPKSPFFKG